MNFSSKELMCVVENIIKKITHDLSNPMSAIINACEVSRFQKSTEVIEKNHASNLNSIFQNASNSLYRKINLIRYLFISCENINLNHEDEIFFEILYEFENKNLFNLNFDVTNSDALFKKILAFCVSFFSYFVSNNSIVNFYESQENSQKFFFEFEAELKCLDEINSIVDFLSADLNFEKDKEFLNPIEILIFYFKIFLKSENFLIDKKIRNENKIAINFFKKL